MVAARNVQINGEVGGAARVATDQLTINGSIGQELVVFGNNVLVTDSATVGGPIAGGATQLTIGGTVGDDVTAGVTTLVINGTVDGSVDVQAEEVRVGGSASIAGDLTYRSRNEARIASGAQIGGSVERLEPEAEATSAVTDNPFLNLLGLWLGLLVLGYLILFVRPAHLVGVAAQLQERPLLSAGVGVLVWIGQIVAVISLIVLAVLFALVAAPLGGAFAAPIVVVCLLIIILALIAQVYVAAGIGQAIAGRVELSSYLAYAVGALIWAAVFVLASVVHPALGALLYFAAWFLALGALTLHILNRRRAEAIVVPQPVAPAQPAPAEPPPA
jgi:cytoskeletal protein CcmA (bactofilin family)